MSKILSPASLSLVYSKGCHPINSGKRESAAAHVWDEEETQAAVGLSVVPVSVMASRDSFLMMVVLPLHVSSFLSSAQWWFPPATTACTQPSIPHRASLCMAVARGFLTNRLMFYMCHGAAALAEFDWPGLSFLVLSH